MFSFAQEENVTFFYVNPNTTVFGLEHISSAHKQELNHKEKPTLYIVENTIFKAPQDFSIVTLPNKDAVTIYNAINKNKELTKHQRVIAKAETAKLQSKTKVAQIPFPFSLPVEQKQTTVSAIATTTVTPTIFSKTTNKLFVFDNFFSVLNRKALSKKQNATCYNQNSKPFQIKIKYCNKPPPFCS